MTGSAVHETALLVREKALETAAELLQAEPADLDIAGGVVFRADQPDRASVTPTVTLAEIARRRGDALAAEGFYTTDEPTFPYGMHFAVVKVDGETGRIEVERFLVAYDVGRAVNMDTLEGQLVGGVLQGIGGALYEEFAYDADGTPLAVTFADYLMPTLDCAPDTECLVTEDAPSPRNPLGLKGGGEGGINGAGAAIAGAIDEALGIPGAVTRLPVTPQRIREILRERDRA